MVGVVGPPISASGAYCLKARYFGAVAGSWSCHSRAPHEPHLLLEDMWEKAMKMPAVLLAARWKALCQQKQARHAGLSRRMYPYGSSGGTGWVQHRWQYLQVAL